MPAKMSKLNPSKDISMGTYSKTAKKYKVNSTGMRTIFKYVICFKGKLSMKARPLLFLKRIKTIRNAGKIPNLAIIGGQAAGLSE